MPKPEFTLKFIKDSTELRRFAETLTARSAFALDIETVNWWNRHQERIALIQIAYRTEGKVKVVIIDALAEIELQLLRPPLEQSSALKIIHNAAFDAVRLEKHYKFKLTNVFDTMVAARRAGERKYSLKAQAATHLQIRLDKSTQTSDWSRRPLDVRQFHYAALDPLATLLLYEHQTKRNLSGDYTLRSQLEAVQNRLPLGESLISLEVAPVIISPPPEAISATAELTAGEAAKLESAMSEVTTAILGIIAELPSRYSPDGLAASIGAERGGLAGWIIDNRLGRDAEPDEETVKLAIADLCERKLIGISETRRLEATATGARIWQAAKQFG